MRIQPGKSGGPVFTSEGVVSLVSTAVFGASLDAHKNWITNKIKGSDQSGNKSLSGRSHSHAQPNAARAISNGEQLPPDGLERFVQVSDAESLRSLGKLKAFRSQEDIVDSITGLPVPQQVATDDIDSTGVSFSRGYFKAPINGDDITLLSAKGRHVSRVIGDTAIFDKSGMHIFGNKNLAADVNGKAIVVVSDNTPGFQSFADRVYLYKGSFGNDLFSSLGQQTLA
jgi:hypothetical protein